MPTDQHISVLTTVAEAQINEPQSAKIIPLRVERWPQVERLVPRTRADQGRHFLKVTLPAIPVTVFTLTFLLSYCMAATEAVRAGRPIDPAPALLASLALTTIVSALCISIYSGYRHVTGLDE